jgi:adenosylcobinamide-GDP ribazoletransferase
MIKTLRNAFGFLTIIPVGMGFDTRDVAKSAWLFPVVGGVIAAIASGLFDIFNSYFSDSISSAVALFALLALTGFHHLDGLLDFGDGLMRIGSAEDRRGAMKDVNTGVGGFAFGFFVLLLTYVALTETTMVLTSLVIAETSAKFSMMMGAFIGKAPHEGMGSAFTKTVNTRLFLATLLVYLAFLTLLPVETGMMVIAAVVVSSLFIIGVSSKLFGGVSGDIFGAMNEIIRMLVLLVLLL